MKDYTYSLLPPASEARRTGLATVLAIATILIALAVGTFSAFAQSSGSIAGSEASADVDVSTGAIAGSQINNYGQKAGKDNRTYQEVATAPSLGGLALGGGHPCAYSPATAQISIIGGGAGIGGMKVDSACMLMVMGAARQDQRYYTAANLVIAGRDKSACRAMEQAGLVDCVERERGGILNPRSADEPPKDWSKSATAASSKGTNVGWGAKCDLQGKKLIFQPTSKEAREPELQACMARFKLK